MADLQTVKIRDLIETTQIMTTDYMVLEKDTGTFKCQARYLKGATGLTPNVQVGNTTTLAPGQLATVTQRGNTENPVFDFGIPQGVQGQTGPQGPKGDTPDITPLQTQIDNRFNALTSQQQGSSEVIEARGGYPALKARLDAINDDLIKYNDQTIVTHTTQSNFSSIDATKNGYLDNVLLEGKTLVVDSNNNVVIPGTQGATLKSVGDGVTEIKLNSITSNLFDGQIKFGDINDNNGTEIDSYKGNTISTNYNLCEGGSTYNIKGVSQSTYAIIYEYDYNKNYIRKQNISSNGIVQKTFDVKTNYFKIKFQGNYNIKMFISKNPVYDNMNFKKDIKKVLYKDTDGTWKKPTLRQWDSIEKHSDGKYYYHKRSSKTTLNGSSGENWIKYTQLTNCSVFYLKLVNQLGSPNTALSDKFVYQHSYNDIEHCHINESGFNITILNSKLNTSDVSGFKQWLQNNNVNVVYKLANEEIYECTPIDLISYDTQTNYSIECGPIYPKTTLKVNSYLGNVVSILKDKVSYLENMLVDGLKLVVAGNMQELAYRLYPQDFVENVDGTVVMEVIK